MSEAVTPGETSLPPSTTTSQANFEKLDRNIVKLWRLSYLAGGSIFALPVFIAGLVMLLNIRETTPYVWAFWIMVLVFLGYRILFFPSQLYKSWGYRIDDRVLEIRSGVYFRTLKLIPLTRLQHVDLQRGPMDRFFGVANLWIYTAGTQQSSIRLPGLSENVATALRDKLVALGGDDGV